LLLLTRAFAVFLGLGLAASLALFGGALFQGHTFVERDLFAYYRAAKSLVPRLLEASGGIPYWNPYFASGQPFAANPEHAIFHPATWLLVVLPFEWGFRLQVILPPLVAAGSMHLLLRSLGRSAWAAAFGGLAWGFGGYTLSVTNLLPTLLTACVFPAVLAFAVRVLDRARSSDVAGLAVALGLECLAGDPVTLLATPVPLLAALAHAFLRRPRRDRSAHAVRSLTLGLALGLALGSAALLPALRLASKTARAAGLPPGESEAWSMPAARMLEFFAPFALGHVEGGGVAFRGLYGGLDTPFLYSLYPGLLTTSLGLAALFSALARPGRRRSRPLLVWAATGGLGLLLALGSHFPLWPLVRRLPLVSGTRYPERLALLACLALTVLAAIGFDRLVRRSRATRRDATGLLAGVALFGAASASRDGLLLLCVAGILIAAVACAGRLPSRAGATLLVALATADVVAHGRRLVPTRPAALLSTPPPIVQQILDARTSGPVFHAAGWLAARERGYGFVRPPVPAFWGIATTFEPDFDLTELAWSARATQRFLQVLEKQPATGYALLKRRGAEIMIRLRRDAKVEGGAISAATGADSPLELRFLTPAQPFAFCVRRVERARGEPGWVAAALRLGSEAWTAAIVDVPEGEWVPAEPSPGRVTLIERTPCRILLEAEAEGPAASLIAVNQTWDQDWRALVDGVPARLLRTDLSLSAVVVPPGRHRVELAYRDPWVLAGLGISGAALVGVTALLTAATRRPSHRTMSKT
jgi:hypothetical protein